MEPTFVWTKFAVSTQNHKKIIGAKNQPIKTKIFSQKKAPQK
jgi:hypothetical protein